MEKEISSRSEKEQTKQDKEFAQRKSRLMTKSSILISCSLLALWMLYAYGNSNWWESDSKHFWLYAILPVAMLLTINGLMVWKLWLEDVLRKDENTYGRIARYTFNTILLPGTYICIQILIQLPVLDELTWGAFFQDVFDSRIFAVTLVAPSLFYSVFGAMKASTAATKTEEVIQDLVNTQVTTSSATSDFAECFNVALVQPLNEKSANWELGKVSLLLSNPTYGFYSGFSLGKCDDFWGKFFDSYAKRELILFSPDAHYNFLVRWLLSIAVNGIHRDREGWVKAINVVQNLIKDRIGRMESNADGDVDKLKLWLTHDSGYRVAKYDYELLTGSILDTQRRSNVFILLTHLSSLQRSPQDFTATLLPITQNLHASIAGSDKSIFEQFKQCPYSYETGDGASVQSSGERGNEFDSIAMDLLYLRTSHRLFHMAYLKSLCIGLHEQPDANGHKKTTRFADTIKTMISCSIYYFENLPKVMKEESVLEILKSNVQNARIKKVIGYKLTSDLESAGVDYEDVVRDILASEEADKGTISHFANEFRFFETEVLKSKAEECDYCIAVLYYVLASGFRESVYAKNRRLSTI